MNEFTGILAAASLEAQSILSQLQGATGENVLIAGENYIGVFGQAQVVNFPTASGGYKRRAQMPLTMTRAQFSSPPVAKTSRVLRLDVSPQIEYLVDVVDVNDPLVYTLILVKSGD